MLINIINVKLFLNDLRWKKAERVFPSSATDRRRRQGPVPGPRGQVPTLGERDSPTAFGDGRSLKEERAAAGAAAAAATAAAAAAAARKG